jgi:hypothetical protein
VCASELHQLRELQQHSVATVSVSKESRKRHTFPGGLCGRWRCEVGPPLALPPLNRAGTESTTKPTRHGNKLLGFPADSYACHLAPRPTLSYGILFPTSETRIFLRLGSSAPSVSQYHAPVAHGIRSTVLGQGFGDTSASHPYSQASNSYL